MPGSLAVCAINCDDSLASSAAGSLNSPDYPFCFASGIIFYFLTSKFILHNLPYLGYPLQLKLNLLHKQTILIIRRRA